MMALWITLGVVVVIIIALVTPYNRLVALRNRVYEATEGRF